MAGKPSGTVAFVRDAGVREHVLVDMAAPDLAHGLHLLRVLLGDVVLLAVLMQPVVALDIVAFRGLSFRLAFMQLLDQPGVGSVAVHPFGVLLRPRLVLSALSHAFVVSGLLVCPASAGRKRGASSFHHRPGRHRITMVTPSSRSMTFPIRLVPVLLAALSGCRTSSSPAPTAARTSAYVVQLGRDTIAVDQFTRVGDRLEGMLVTRAPRTTMMRYVVTLNADGTPESAESSARLPDGTPIPNTARGVTVRYSADSAVTRIQRDTAIVFRSAAPGTWPYINYGVAFFQLPIDAMRAARRDSLVTSILAVGARGTTPLTIRPAGANRYVADLFGFRYDLRTDDRGTVQTVDGTGTTQQFLATRRNMIDVAGVAAAWAERERLTQAMGMLSPRDTARATIGAAQIFVDYGRPSARGRRIFAANGILNDTLWRTGANAATQLSTSVPIRIGGHDVPAGKYTLWTVAVPGRYQLVVNRQTGQWGTVYDSRQDLVRVPLTVTPLSEHVERFTIVVDPGAGGSGVLRLRWATTELSVPITVP